MQSLRLLKLSCYLYCFCGCINTDHSIPIRVRDTSSLIYLMKNLTLELMWNSKYFRIFRVVLLFNYQGSFDFAVSFEAACLLYHTHCIMSTTFFKFIFLFLTLLWQLASAVNVILSHLQKNVNNKLYKLYIQFIVSLHNLMCHLL